MPNLKLIRQLWKVAAVRMALTAMRCSNVELRITEIPIIDNMKIITMATNKAPPRWDLSYFIEFILCLNFLRGDCES